MVGPFAGLQYLHLDVNDFNETGVAPVNLRVGEDLDSLRSRLGARVVYNANVHKHIALALEGTAAWQHELLDEHHQITALFIGSGAQPFVTDTVGRGRDAALLGAGINTTFWNTFTFFVDYDAQVGQDDFLEQGAKGGLRVNF